MASLVISPATALRAVLEATAAAAVATVVATAAVTEVAAVAAAWVGRLATRAAVMATCRVTARRDRSATTVSIRDERDDPALTKRSLGGEVGHLSRECPQEASTERVCYKCKMPGHIQAACPN